jgi:addiction module HigA family antidote
VDSRAARRALPAIWNRAARRRLDLLDVARTPEELEAIPGNRLADGTLRVSDVYRIGFVWTDRGPAEVSILPDDDRLCLGRPEVVRRPTHPGEIIRYDVIRPLRLLQQELAVRLGVSHRRLNEIINGRRLVTPDTALRLAAVLGSPPELWLNLQQAVDLWDARQ